MQSLLNADVEEGVRQERKHMRVWIAMLSLIMPGVIGGCTPLVYVWLATGTLAAILTGEAISMFVAMGAIYLLASLVCWGGLTYVAKSRFHWF